MEDSGIDTTDVEINIKHNKHPRRANEQSQAMSKPKSPGTTNNKKVESESSASSDEEWNVRGSKSNTFYLAKRSIPATDTGRREASEKNPESNQAFVHQPRSQAVAETSSGGRPNPFRREDSSLLVDVPISESDSDEEMPLSWQRSNRAMRDQLLKDGFNLDLESDNEDLDLIPPKQNYGMGGVCSCSNGQCVIS